MANKHECLCFPRCHGVCKDDPAHNVNPEDSDELVLEPEEERKMGPVVFQIGNNHFTVDEYEIKKRFDDFEASKRAVETWKTKQPIEKGPLAAFLVGENKPELACSFCRRIALDPI